jgi:hypothetical protein
MEQQIVELKSEVKSLTEAVRRLEVTCARMDRHITGVESLFEQVQAPASYVKRQIERLMGISNTSTLPELRLQSS